MFEQLDAACRPDAVLATNTSYLDPNAIAAVSKVPERILGLHFFSPANIMKLLEIVPASATAPDVVATGLALARSLGKIPVLAGVCDGFIGNRILKNNRPVLERLLLSGVRPAEIDAAMRGFGLAMGPFEVQDLSGLDIAGMQRKAARERGETPFAPIGDRLFEAGRLGQKTGGGWYDYTPGERAPKSSQAVEAIIAEEAQRHPVTRFETDELADCIVFPMIDEGARILAEGIAKRPADIDLVQIHGYGFPRWRGGLMHYAETRGLSEIVGYLAQDARCRAGASAERAIGGGGWCRSFLILVFAPPISNFDDQRWHSGFASPGICSQPWHISQRSRMCRWGQFALFPPAPALRPQRPLAEKRNCPRRKIVKSDEHFSPPNPVRWKKETHHINDLASRRKNITPVSSTSSNPASHSAAVPSSGNTGHDGDCVGRDRRLRAAASVVAVLGRLRQEVPLGTLWSRRAGVRHINLEGFPKEPGRA